MKTFPLLLAVGLICLGHVAHGYPASDKDADVEELLVKELVDRAITNEEIDMIKILLREEITYLVKMNANAGEIEKVCREYKVMYNLAEDEVIVLVWKGLMSSVRWSKKEELVADQALRHLKTYALPFVSFTTQGKSELALLLEIQDFCYENTNFMKVFQKIVVHFYKADVLSKDVILKWYKESHLEKGKSIFLEQTKTLVEFLQYV